MQANEQITLMRDVDALLIPSGTQITIPEGSEVYITQALGGNYTVNINGNLAQIASQNADALGFEVDQSSQINKSEVSDIGEVDEELVWDQIRTCYDPEIPINVVDLGLIYKCDITKLDGGGNRIDILMTLTAPGCGMGDFIAEEVRQFKVQMLPNVTEINVEMTFDPPWNQEMMSDAAKLETGMYY